MATRHGWEKAQALLAKGWKLKPEEEDTLALFTCDDPVLIDYQDGKEYNPYDAEEIQRERDVEDWHNGGYAVSLHTYLGMTWEEYSKWSSRK